MLFFAYEGLMGLTALGLVIARCLRELAVALRIGPGPRSCTYKTVRGTAMASWQELADVAQAAEALCLFCRCRRLLLQ